MAKILIIDDDSDIVEAMKVVLEAKQYEVIAANSGEEGLKKLKSSRPDLVILDVMMETPDKGFDVARQIKSDKNFRDIPILMLTAIGQRTGLDFKSEAGDKDWLPVNEYCDKPLNPSELTSKVEALLRK